MIIPVNAFADEFPYLFNRYYTEPPKFCLINPSNSDVLDEWYNRFVIGMKNWETLLSVNPGEGELEEQRAGARDGPPGAGFRLWVSERARVQLSPSAIRN